MDQTPTYEELSRRIKELEETSKITRFTVDRVQDAIYWTGPDAHFIYVNEAACRALGYSQEELLTMTVQDIDPECPAETWPEHWTRLQHRGSFTIETLYRRKDGTDFPVEVAVNFIKIGEKEFNCAFARDLTERKKTQEGLVRAQKLEAVGTLAGGIAHDFNNLLSIIMGYISLAEDDINPKAGGSEFLKEAEKASLRAQELTKQLMTFSKSDAPVKKGGAIGDLVKEATDVLLPGPNVEFEVFISHDLWPIEFDEGHMRHAVKSLIFNAVESMPDGGTVDVRVENCNISPGIEDRRLPLSEGNYIKISIQDQGVGISKEHLPKIFDPYFSTKEIGTQKGMGLGLATTYSIVNKHNGHIAVKSEVGIGTTFSIYLPALEKITADVEPVKKLTPEKPAALTGRILVMDDEEMIRAISKQILSRLSYEPELAKDGAQAIELYKRAMNSGKPFDAVILDLTVKGGIGGQEAVKTLLKIDPQAKAVVSSGYSNDPVMNDFRAYGFVGALAKPYKMKGMRDVLNTVIMGKSILPS